VLQALPLERLPVVKSRALAWGEPVVVAPYTTFRRLDVDLDGTGTWQVVLNWTYPAREGEAHEAEVFVDSQVFATLRDQVPGAWRHESGVEQVPSGEEEYYPIGLNRKGEGVGPYNTQVAPAGDPQWASKVAGAIAAVQSRLPTWLANGC
jgi:hypothetical protein